MHSLLLLRLDAMSRNPNKVERRHDETRRLDFEANVDFQPPIPTNQVPLLVGKRHFEQG